MSPVKTRRAHRGCGGTVRQVGSDPDSLICGDCQLPVSAAACHTVPAASDNGRRPGDQARPGAASSGPQRGGRRAPSSNLSGRDEEDPGDPDSIPEDPDAIPAADIPGPEDPEAAPAEAIPLTVRSLDQLLAEPDEPLDVVIGDGAEGAVLTADGKGVIDAGTGVGKTNLLLRMSRCLCEASPVLGLPIPEPRTVVYLCLEGSRRNMKRRLRKIWAGAPPEARARFHFAMVTLDLSDAGALEGLRQLLEKLRPDVLVLDPLRNAHPWDENSSHEVTRLTTILDALTARYGCALLLAHHDRKRPPFVRTDAGTDRLRGSTAFGGWLSFSLSLDPDASGTDRLLANWGKHRDAERALEPMTLDFDREHIDFIVSDRAPNGAIAELTIQAAILSAANPEGWAHGPDLIRGLMKAGAGETRIRERIRAMVKSGRLQERTDKPTQAKSYSLADPPTEMDLGLDA